MLTEPELTRYQRQMIITGWGEEGQQKLNRAKVLVAGAGGLGSAILTYLAAAGVGQIRVIDSDRVELSNLNRQTLYTSQDIGLEKVAAAKQKLEAFNPNIRVEAIHEEITEGNVFDLVADYPIVDAMDNLTTRYLLNKVAVRRNLPLFHGAVHGFEGRATTIIPDETPCLRCIYQGVVADKTPVAGVTPGIIGCIQATEVIKYLVGIGELLTGRLLVYDGFGLTFTELKVSKDPSCHECARSEKGE